MSAPAIEAKKIKPNLALSHLHKEHLYIPNLQAKVSKLSKESGPEGGWPHQLSLTINKRNILLWLEAHLAYSFIYCEVVFSSQKMGRIAMGDDRLSYVHDFDDISGSGDLSDLAGPLAQLAGILVKLENSAAYKDHPGLHVFGEALTNLGLCYRAMLQIH